MSLSPLWLVPTHLSQRQWLLRQDQEDRSCQMFFPAATASHCASSASPARWRHWPQWTRRRRREHLPPKQKMWKWASSRFLNRPADMRLTLMCFPLLPITKASSTSQSTSFRQKKRVWCSIQKQLCPDSSYKQVLSVVTKWQSSEWMLQVVSECNVMHKKQVQLPKCLWEIHLHHSSHLQH